MGAAIVSRVDAGTSTSSPSFDMSRIPPPRRLIKSASRSLPCAAAGDVIGTPLDDLRRRWLAGVMVPVLSRLISARPMPCCPGFPAATSLTRGEDEADDRLSGDDERTASWMTMRCSLSASASLGFSLTGDDDGVVSAVERRMGDMRWKDSFGGGGRGASLSGACEDFTGDGGGDTNGAGGSLDVTGVSGERTGGDRETTGFVDRSVLPWVKASSLSDVFRPTMGGRDVISLISKRGRGRPPLLELAPDAELAGLRGGTKAARGSSSDESVSESFVLRVLRVTGDGFGR